MPRLGSLSSRSLTGIGIKDTLSLAPSISSATVSAVTFTSSEVSNIEDLDFSTDGTKMYLMHRTTTTLYQYNLSTPWNVSTASYSNNSVVLTTQLGTGRQVGFVFSQDGTKMYAQDISGRTIYQYNLGTAWDLSTIGNQQTAQRLPISVASSFPCSIFFAFDGLSVFTCDPISDKVDRFLLGTAWDLSTASTIGRTSFVTTANVGAPQGITFYNAYNMYVTDQNSRTYQYSLTAPWDITTAAYVRSGPTMTTSGDIVIGNGGTMLWPASASSTVTQWNVTLA